jgi:hypothetical protein
LVGAEGGEDGLEARQADLVALEPVALHHVVVLDRLRDVLGALLTDSVASLVARVVCGVCRVVSCVWGQRGSGRAGGP